MILLNNGSKHCIFFISYSKLVLIRSVQQGKSLQTILICAFQFTDNWGLSSFNHPWWFKCVSGLLGSSFVFGTLELKHHLPVQRLVLTRPQHLDKVKVPASLTPQVLDLYHLQGHYFLLVLSLHPPLLGQCQAVDSLLCLGSSLVSLHLALEQLLIPVSMQ